MYSDGEKRTSLESSREDSSRVQSFLSTVCSSQLINLMKSPFYGAEGAAEDALSVEMASGRN